MINIDYLDHLDYRSALYQLQCAQQSFNNATAPLLHKQALIQLAIVYDKMGRIDERNRTASEFRQLDEKYNAVIDWTRL